MINTTSEDITEQRTELNADQCNSVKESEVIVGTVEVSEQGQDKEG